MKSLIEVRLSEPGQYLHKQSKKASPHQSYNAKDFSALLPKFLAVLLYPWNTDYPVEWNNFPIDLYYLHLQILRQIDGTINKKDNDKESYKL